MEAADQQVPTRDEGPEQGADRNVTVHRSSPDRAVFTERDNTDGWIATDHTVDLRR